MGKPSVISLDAMSGDLGAEVVVRAAVASLDKHANLELVLVGKEEQLESLVAANGGDARRLRIQAASEVVEMSEPPADALRKKKDSSMRVAINLVRDGVAEACVSAGNTGALMATAKFVLKMLPGIDRPAITTELPSKVGSFYMLDLGANAVCTADHLFQFALMGSIVAEDLMEVDTPRVALLNIGAEDTKGNDTVREAAVILEASSLNYVGYIEGNDLFNGLADVVVTDGFTGNIALKSMEGMAGLTRFYLREAFTRSWLAKLSGLAARPVLRRLARESDPRQYNGATLAGLNGIVIKSHGGADALAFQHAIDTAVIEVENQLPAQIGRLLRKEAA